MGSCAFSAVIIAIVGVTSLVADKARLFGDPMATSPLSSMVRFPPVTSAAWLHCRAGRVVLGVTDTTKSPKQQSTAIFLFHTCQL
jgi:hypothetical protein